ncbi:hypothetical protein [Deinococcus phoenicis]|nr:hypothetical protein [Deinococcus phoenicis]
MTACGWGQAANPALDGILAVNEGASPCLAIRVSVLENGKKLQDVSVHPDGRVRPLGPGQPPLHFQKGKTYTLQASCVSGGDTFQNTQFGFQAEGRTLMVVFTKSGFVFRRGGLAY